VGVLTDRYCIVGVGETPYSRDSGRTTLSMACEAIKRAADDAGLPVKAIDGVTSYQGHNDSCTNDAVASSLGLTLDYGLDIFGGGSSMEALIGQAIGLIEGGYASVVAGFRSMNGRTGARRGGRAVGGPMSLPVATGMDQFYQHWGLRGAPTRFSMNAMRYLYQYGYDTTVFGAVAVTRRYHATLNPKAVRRTPLTLQEHQASRWIVKPFRLLDCCQENDVAIAWIVTSADRARDLKQPPVYIRGGIARAKSDNPNWVYGRPNITLSVGHRVRDRFFANADTDPRDVEIFSMYDNFTVSPLYYWEAMGYCPVGEGGRFIDGGRRISIDAEYPENLSGGLHSEVYTHGANLVTENERQLRGRVDDFCPQGTEGVHSLDRSQGCRQSMARTDRGTGVSQPRIPEIALSVGSGGPHYLSAIILRR
jgi:acetyl-CoA acetyltransferase